MSIDTAKLTPGSIQPNDFMQFKQFLATRLFLLPSQETALAKTIPARLYSLVGILGLTDQQLAQLIAEFLCLPYMPQIHADMILAGVLPASFCRQYQVAAVFDSSGEKAVVMSNPFDWELQDALMRCPGIPLKPRLLIAAPASLIKLSRQTTLSMAQTAAGSGALTEQDYDLLREVNPEGTVEADAEMDYEILSETQMAKLAKLPPVVRLVNMILCEAVKVGASDIHVEPQEEVLQIRYRIDGALVDSMKVPKHLQPNVISRLKIVARLDIAEHRKPQDGRSRLRLDDRRIDLRVSTLPAQFGEKVVIRLLDGSTAKIKMDRLGLAPDMLVRYQRLLSNPQGMILVTGPTGSGKTSTLYASLNWLKCPTKNIITVEDPIEFQVQGLTQVQIDTKSGTTFAAGLRSILRQDPNIILVGEIRDSETASLALEAAQTGHLLLSTLHTNDSVATITRLLDLGIEPFQVAASVIGILAQRLVRRVCQGCAIDGAPSEDAVEKAGGIERLPVDVNWKVSVGCAACQQTGFKGRMAIHELLEVTEDIRDLIAQRAPDHTIREAARKNGMKGLMEAGLAAAAQGLTTLEEVVRVAPREESLMPDSVPAALNQASSFGWSGKASGGAPAKGIISILLLEDEPDTQALLKLILEKQGYEVVSSPQSETVS